MKKFFTLVALLVVIVAGVLFVKWLRSPKIGHVKDEALQAGFKAEQFKAADEDYFHDMDDAHRTQSGRDQGTQYLDRLDGRQRSHVGQALRHQRRRAGFSEDCFLASRISRRIATIAGNI